MNQTYQLTLISFCLYSRLKRVVYNFNIYNINKKKKLSNQIGYTRPKRRMPWWFVTSYGDKSFI